MKKLYLIEISMMEDNYTTLTVAESVEAAREIAENFSIDDDVITGINIEEIKEVDGYKIKIINERNCNQECCFFGVECSGTIDSDCPWEKEGYKNENSY